MLVNIDTPNSTEMQKNADDMLVMAKSYIIDSYDMVQIAATDLQSIKSKIKELDTQRKEITKPLDAAKAKVMDLFRRPIEILTAAEGAIKDSLISYDQEQKRIIQAEESRLRDIARAKREKCENEVRKIAEVARVKAVELQAKALAETAAGNAAKAAQLQAKAESVIEKAEEKAIEKTIEAESIQAPIILREQPKIKGMSMSTRWKARIVNADKIPREYMIPNYEVLTKIAQSTKGAIKIDGVKFYEVPGVTSRG